MYRTFSRIPGVRITHCLASLDQNIKNWEDLADEGGDKIRTPSDLAAAEANVGATSLKPNLQSVSIH